MSTTLQGITPGDLQGNWLVLARSMAAQVAEFKKLRRRIFRIARLMVADDEHPAMIRTRINEIAEDLAGEGGVTPLARVADMLDEATEAAIEGRPLPPEPADFEMVRAFFNIYEAACLRDGADTGEVAAQLAFWREAFDQAIMETRT